MTKSDNRRVTDVVRPRRLQSHEINFIRFLVTMALKGLSL